MVDDGPGVDTRRDGPGHERDERGAVRVWELENARICMELFGVSDQTRLQHFVNDLDVVAGGGVEDVSDLTKGA